jgi:hypothetical protein
VDETEPCFGYREAKSVGQPQNEETMSWINELGGILDRYVGAQGGQPPATVHDDFDRVAQAAPPSDVADGLAAAFRSDATPPFAQMLAQLFGQNRRARNGRAS